ncbi:hypothetical protein [Achromobacter xylosoxidans]|nr:hypothetical protein [Achromobacter xylosoxidans]WPQ36543.1 hypothetical protein SLH34_06740 [Achromobacter xylosoxidans]
MQAAIQAFSAPFQRHEGHQTSEREGIGEAVWQFSQLARVFGLDVAE